jgi:squalene-associated FAD-dependent desaturase
MKKCIVIGGGFAGLSAAAYLVNAKFNVELIEASPKLGGRAYSFLRRETNTLIDNGQHIMMGCYNYTLEFLSLIGALDKVKIQEKLCVKFLKPDFDVHTLSTFSSFYPFNLISALLSYSAISFNERLSIVRFFLKLPLLSNRDLEKISVDELLIRENQNENVKKAFWEIICVGALNTNLKKASAKIFVDILKEIFLKGSKGSKIVIPKTGLSEMYCEPAKRFIEEKGGSILLAERVEEIKLEKGRAVEVRTDKRSIKEFDFVISAVPFCALERMVKMIEFQSHSKHVSKSEQMLKRSALGGQHENPQHDYPHSINQSFNPLYSSILNVHIWLKENPLGDNFYALIGSKLHWIFSHESHITCVISDADYLMNLSDTEIMEMIYSELKKYLNISRQNFTDYFIIKEKRATFIPSNDILSNRPNFETEIKNLFLAGDWVNTGLPSTIEAAVKSGRIAAKLVEVGMK